VNANFNTKLPLINMQLATAATTGKPSEALIAAKAAIVGNSDLMDKKAKDAQKNRDKALGLNVDRKLSALKIVKQTTQMAKGKAKA